MDIAIVGGGAAAVGLLDALAAAEEGETGTITVFEPSEHLWRGRPYGPDLDSVRVNAPPAIMSIRHGDLGHYAAWLGQRGSAHLDELLGQPLVPRALYGDYLAHTAEKAVAALGEAGRLVRVVPARVNEVVRSGVRLVLRTEDTREYEATHVVLCVGAGAPPDLYGLAGAPGFTSDPYPLAATLAHVDAGDEVAVIGSGLTAVDVVVSLAARGHTGRITLLSRTGVLPHVWQRPIDRRPRHMTAERLTELHQAGAGHVGLDDLIGLLRAELADAGRTSTRSRTNCWPPRTRIRSGGSDARSTPSTTRASADACCRKWRTRSGRTPGACCPNPVARTCGATSARPPAWPRPWSR